MSKTYLRFHQRQPPRGCSYDRRTGEYLRGASAYEGRFLEVGLYEIDLRALDDWGLSLLGWFLAANSPAYLTHGKEIGVGPDGEPLLEIERTKPLPRTTRLSLLTPPRNPLSSWIEEMAERWNKSKRDGSNPHASVVEHSRSRAGLNRRERRKLGGNKKKKRAW